MLNHLKRDRGDELMSFAEYTDAIKAFVTLHREWAAPIVFVLAFGESLAFVSLILPFWGMLVVIGTIIGATDSLSFWGIMTAAAVGAALGDWLSYWLGYHYHEQIARMWPLNRYPNLLPQGHKFFTRWGAWAVVVGRFSGPLRASVPIVAGITQMPALRFQTLSVRSPMGPSTLMPSPSPMQSNGVNDGMNVARHRNAAPTVRTLAPMAPDERPIAQRQKRTCIARLSAWALTTWICGNCTISSIPLNGIRHSVLVVPLKLLLKRKRKV